MIYENDKLNIPEKYRKMSVSELRKEKEKVYKEFRRNSIPDSPKFIHKNESIKFHF